MAAIFEPFALGFSSGLTCVGSCGAVLAPWLASSGSGPGRTVALLGVFLSGRFAGYMIFAVASWVFGLAVPLQDSPENINLVWINLLLAALLGYWALFGSEGSSAKCGTSRLNHLCNRLGWLGAALMGLLTGLNLCPPFLVASLRASQAGDLLGTILFFAVFFAGTALWFAPFAAAGLLRRWKEVAVVARMTLGLVAIYYFYIGVSALAWRLKLG